MSYRIEPIPAMKDNYIWSLRNTENQRTLIVDPGESAPVEDFLERHGLILDAILVTHHHPDHVAGVNALVSAHPVPVYGPAESSWSGATHPLREGDHCQWQELDFEVIAVPGHTLDHIAFNCTDPALEQPVTFCGDALFVCGCGRLFEGTPAQMRHSLDKLRSLPDDTLVCGGHEYTLANLAFSRAVNPDDEQLRDFEAHCQKLRAEGQPTLPSTIGQEKRLNPFLQWDNTTIASAALNYCQSIDRELDPSNPDDVFGAIRHWKDNFRA